MLPVLIIGALVALGIAASSKARATAETPTPPALPKPKAVPPTRLSIRTPPPKVLKAKRAIIKATTPAVQKKVAQAVTKKITEAAIQPVSQKAVQTLQNLVMTSVDAKAPASVRKAAQKQVKKIVAKPATVRAAEINKLPTQAKVVLAKAVLESEATTPTADQAARTLQIWTKNGGNQGTKTNRSQAVMNAQKLMGLTADGIIGPNTRKRAAELGYPLAPRSAQKPGAVGYQLLGY